VRSFYDNPTGWTGEATLGVRGAMEDAHDFFGLVGNVISRVGAKAVTVGGAALLGSAQPASGTFPLEDDLRKDANGLTQWNRYIVGKNGHRKPLFMAGFSVENRQIRETFMAAGTVKVPLYFDATPYRSGVKLTLDRSHSSELFTRFATIEFITKPAGDGGVDVHGQVTYKNLSGAQSTFAARLYPHSGRELRALAAL
jgi:hypothetical protein